MRILAALALISSLVLATPLSVAKANEVINQNAKQKLETQKNNQETLGQDKRIKSFSDNFVVAIYIPKTSKTHSSNRSGSRIATESFALPFGSFIVNASAYTAAADECGKSDGITASGSKVQANRTLACPPGYKFGTKIAIDGMGSYVCEDRGGAIKGNHFDIYMPTKSEAFAFGRRSLVASIVE